MKNQSSSTLHDFNRCTRLLPPVDGVATVECRLGLWSVSGKMSDIGNEALHYFYQYKSDGEYSEIIGGKSVLEVLLEVVNKGDR